MFIFTLPSLGKAQRVREELSSLQYGVDYKISIGELSLPSDFPMLDMLIYKCDLEWLWKTFQHVKLLLSWQLCFLQIAFSNAHCLLIYF